ncbi:dihydrolipoyl dehydrogenase [Microbacterium sp. SSW1-59]|uniref:dihydrolipoyl dehydrogenase n=1 Tax=Microbacterium xanthum TaxID=3079794 RepID=UPI002AD4413D|nr:dihydrolipoyl dehydrogenase [Microbacterium sp. SSW1-59]MDZ8202361.1 dihydrolipoyl dehydrogenase [Microbacterium sp. SSW1-59]
MSVQDYDLVVLGGGSGGYAAALRAAELGSSVAIVEKDKLGGTCLHRGCVPTKALLHAGEIADHTREAAALGIRATWEGVDVAALTSYREGIVAKKHQGLQGLIAARGITVIPGAGTLEPGPAVRVGGDLYRGKDVVVATGSATRTLPGIQLGGRIVGSEQALELPAVPDRVTVLGGGVIGVEFASLWRSLGAEVTVIEALPRLLPADDPVISSHMERAFRKRGIRTALGSPVAAVSAEADRVLVRLQDGTEIDSDLLLVAVGRAPVTAGLGLEQAGVVLDRGFVVVDDDLRTGAEHVWAVGDIVAGPQLAHRGFQQGIQVAERIAGRRPVHIPDHHIPRVTYSSPEAASVGLTEAAARELHGDSVETFEYNLAGNAKSAILGTPGVVKVVRRTAGPVLGVHMVGDRVGELVAEAQLVVGWEAHPEDVAPFLHAHPTQSEALGEAFLALAGSPLHTL